MSDSQPPDAESKEFCGGVSFAIAPPSEKFVVSPQVRESGLRVWISATVDWLLAHASSAVIR
ncbi:uncharacterized protein N7518_002990 [Penicillium psychrosexuale]|uniref:uncharacterized protein n=1 Tax=Penicillium psychrosexuale TaxID=1002107 RepID=UPI002545073D|nr:uncharacterized protein N7518_002990 [Penicillium psychrosexuale]KAJ5800922.1 hypothetical protein N7518_002990 [Penicillium psychrosexuale]